jgi:4-hydroxy-tetrahydrodipicolinate synthase
MTVPATPLVITATPTLFAADETLAEGEIRAHLEWLREQGVDAIFPAGTSGEFPTLDDDERLRILEIALDVFPADAVYLHVGAAGGRQAERLVRRAVAAGATRLAAITPHFQPAPAPQVLDYYSRLVDAAGDAEVYAYLFEARTTTLSTPDVLPLLAERGVAGVKISGQPDDAVAGYLGTAPEGFAVFSGNDISFGWLIQHGGHGIVSGVSSAYPEAFVGLRDALLSGDAAAIERAESIVRRAVEVVRAGSLTHLKAGIAARGFAPSPVRTSVAGVDDADAHAIRAFAAEMDELRAAV